MMNERVTELTTYLTALSSAHAAGYKCHGEIGEAIKALRLEALWEYTDDTHAGYRRRIVEICGELYSEKHRLVNELIYTAYRSGFDGEVFLSRCSGTTTSIDALNDLFPDVVYVKSQEDISFTDFTDKVVFVEGRVELPRWGRPKCVIKIRQIDFTGDNSANIF
jgi:hypothetical protein